MSRAAATVAWRMSGRLWVRACGQIIGMVPGGPAKLSGMLQENDTLLKVRSVRTASPLVSLCG